MIRQVIQIDEEKCNGCGLCANACHEGAIGIINGVAKLLRDDYCDGMGDCLPHCPQGAIRFITREAAAYDAGAVAEHMRKRSEETEKALTGQKNGSHSGCPETAARTIVHESNSAIMDYPMTSGLSNFPIQLKLAPVTAPYFDFADLLVAADCTAYAYGDFHNRFIRNRVTVIGCPKLDNEDYSIKLAEILKGNSIQSVTLTRMTVPCCGGLERMLRMAVEKSGKRIPLRVVTIHMDGRIVREEDI